jgi:hypothetical protein
MGKISPAATALPERTPPEPATEELRAGIFDEVHGRADSGPGSGVLHLLSGELTPARMVALLLADQQERWRGGHRVSAESYLGIHPTLGDHPDALALLVGEWRLRHELGEAPAADEYVERFPRFAARFREHLASEQAATSSDWLRVDNVANQPVPRPDDDTLLPAQPSGVPAVVAGYEIVRELGRGTG